MPETRHRYTTDHTSRSISLRLRTPHRTTCGDDYRTATNYVHIGTNLMGNSVESTNNSNSNSSNSKAAPIFSFYIYYRHLIDRPIGPILAGALRAVIRRCPARQCVVVWNPSTFGMSGGFADRKGCRRPPAPYLITHSPGTEVTVKSHTFPQRALATIAHKTHTAIPDLRIEGNTSLRTVNSATTTVSTSHRSINQTR